MSLPNGVAPGGFAPPLRPENAELSREVVVRAQQGDRAAQSEVLRRYVRVLHRLAVTTGAGHDAEELVQAMLTRLLEVLPRFEVNGPAKLTTWVFTIAHRYLLDQQKRVRPKLVAVENAAALEAPVDLLGAAWRAEVRSALERALKTLPDEQRRPLVLVHVFDHPLDEVAVVEGVPVGTIKSRLFRARVAMAAVLGPQFA
ncbi:MAG: RNA polymerase sigma factor, partial [Archangium sp.]|nr:RNA polymerase sigma factor [Archangium sp.]